LLAATYTEKPSTTRVTPGVPQGSVLGPLLFLAYVNDICKNIQSNIRLYADDCIIYRKILNIKDVAKLQRDIDRLGDWAGGNETKINPNKRKALSFTRARVKELLNYSLGDQKIPEASCCKYLEIIIRSDLSWADQVNYTVTKARTLPNICVVLCIVCFVSFSVLFVCAYMCTVLLPPCGYPVAVKYIISYHIISYHIISYHIKIYNSV